jgi:predicted dehydrogenase
MSAASLATVLSGKGLLHAATKERIRLGLIGCGARGTGAALDCIEASPDVVITVLAIFSGQADAILGTLKEKLKAESLAVSPETCFTGFDAYKKVLTAEVDLVILGAPPFFRPQHLQAAVEAGKHVFMEKPVAVDPPGVRSIIASSELATKKRLSIVAGTQRRHQAHYIEIMKRISRGDIGEIVAGQCYWNMGALWVERAAQNWADRIIKNWSDMEWQIRNWLFTVWCSGDHIVEQHVHNLDVMNWALCSHPVKCTGMGDAQHGPIQCLAMSLTTLRLNMNIPMVPGS